MTQWGLDTLFNPAKRHMDEEKRRLQATRQQVGDTSGGKRIDLESGKVRIGKARDAEEADIEATENDEVDEVDEPGEHEEPSASDTSEAKKPAPSPAAVRAAQRRGRKPR